MKHAKRAISMLLAAMTICTTLPLNALAAENDIIYPAGTVIDDDSGEIVESTPTEWIEEDTWDEIDDPDEVVEIPEGEEENTGEEADFDAEEYEEEINRIFFGDVTEDEPAAIAVTDERTPPSRPVSVSIDRTTLTVSSTGKGDIEYSIDSGENWQDSGTFTDLTPGKEYTIIARLKATDTDPATEPSAPLTVSTVPKDTYMVASEEDLQTAFAEVSTLPATQERINIRFTKSITVSDTVVLPRLKGRMELFLDLYGFTLTCTKANVPVVQIETRATLGSSYYLDSGVSSEQVRGGHLTASGEGMAILISPNAVAKLRGLTFTCGSIAIENQGDLSVMENVHGGIQNSGYIESINGMKTENGIVNDGTIEEIKGCQLGSVTATGALCKDDYAAATNAVLVNNGIIDKISDTKIVTGNLVAFLNAETGEIGELTGENYFRNSNSVRGAALLNRGTIDTISEGMYLGYRSCVINYGEISHISGGFYFQALHEYSESALSKFSGSDLTFLQTAEYPKTIVANYGSLPDISGGYFNNNSTGVSSGTWRRLESDIYHYGNTWAWTILIENESDSAAFAYRDGYALSRSWHTYETANRYDDGSHTTYFKRRAYQIDKAYTVTYDTTETKWCMRVKVNNVADCEHFQVTNESCIQNVPNYYYIIEGEDEQGEIEAQTEIAYIAGDTVASITTLGIYPVRYVDGILDYSEKTPKYLCNECQKIKLAYINDMTYSYRLTFSNGASSDSFIMPEENVTVTPQYSYKTNLTVQKTYTNYYTLTLSSKSRWLSPDEICSAGAWELKTYDGDAIDWQGSETGYSYSLTAYNLQKTQSQEVGSTWAPSYYQYRYYSYKFEDRYKYQWSINKEDWYEEEEIPLTSELLSTEGVTISRDFSKITIPLYMRKAPIGGGVDENVTPGKAVKVTNLQINAPYKPFSEEYTVNITKDGGYNGKLYFKASSDCAYLVRFILIDEDGTESLVEKKNISCTNSSYNNVNIYTDYISVSEPSSSQKTKECSFTISGLEKGQQVRAEYLYEDLYGRYLQRTSGWWGTCVTQDCTDSYDINVMYAQPFWKEAVTQAFKKSQTAPTTAPTVIERLDTSITIATDGDLEFSIDGGKTWQTDGTFSNLTPGKEYTIISRYPETDNSYASSASPGLTVSTRESVDILQAPTLVSKTDSTLTVTALNGFEYSIDGGENWQSDSTFSNLSYGTEYEIVSRKTSEPDYLSPILKVRTAFSAPVPVSRTDTELVIETVDGAEYQISGGSSWQTGGTFAGLSPNTEYTITARKRTEHDSLSDTLKIKTKNVQAAPAAAPTLEGKTDTELAVIPENNLEYSIDGGKTWVDDGYFNGLTEDTEYNVISRFPETDDAVASPASPALSVITKFTQTASPVAPKVLNITTNSIQIETVDGQEYALREEDETELVRPWQEEDTFRGLDSETSYEIITRLGETETTAASPLCPQIIVVFTKQYVSIGGSSVDESDNKTLHTAYIYGYPDGTIHPEESITRAEAAAMFSTAFALDESVEEVSIFSDISVNDWYFAQIQQMAKAGYLSGYPDGTFKPEQGMTRAEFVALALKFTSKSTGSNVEFSDIEDSWAKKLIEQAASINLVYGYEDGTFRPENTITRAEAISILNVLLGRYNLCAKEHGVTRSYFSDNQNQNAWYYHAILEASTPHIVELD